jgi:predicted dehydrogenase
MACCQVIVCVGAKRNGRDVEIRPFGVFSESWIVLCKKRALKTVRQEKPMSHIPPAPPLRLGILGCANIARQFARDAGGSPAVALAAVASRNAPTAAAFAAAHGIARHHGSYEALLADPDVDAVYIPLPNSLHAAWAIRAADHGKHVLCEKPLATNAREARAMFDAARRNRVMLLEAYPYWFQPQTGRLVEMLNGGTIGRVKSVQAAFGFMLISETSDAASNIRMNPDLGGGALLDAGSYAASLIRLAMGCVPQRVSATATWAASGVDAGVSATLLYADGRRAQLSCAMDTAYHRHALIVGSKGVIETDYLNHSADAVGVDPRGWLPSHVRLRRGTTGDTPFEAVEAPSGSGFRFEAEAFAKVVAERDFDAIERAAAASIDIAATLEAIALSAREGRPAEVRVPESSAA